MTITEKVMRDLYVSREECLNEWEAIDRLHNSYIAAAASFEAFIAEQSHCICDHDGGYGDDGLQVKRFPVSGCPIHAEEDEV